MISRMCADVEPGAPLSRDVERVFSALGSLLSHCPHDDDSVLRPLMRSVVLEARAAGLQAEMLLRLLKESWRSLPEPTSGDGRLGHYDALNRVVSLCIREFYRDDSGR